MLIDRKVGIADQNHVYYAQHCANFLSDRRRRTLSEHDRKEGAVMRRTLISGPQLRLSPEELHIIEQLRKCGTIHSASRHRRLRHRQNEGKENQRERTVATFTQSVQVCTCRHVIVMSSGRKFLVGGNWKCHGTGHTLTELASNLASATLPSPDIVGASLLDSPATVPVPYLRSL